MSGDTGGGVYMYVSAGLLHNSGTMKCNRNRRGKGFTRVMTTYVI